MAETMANQRVAQRSLIQLERARAAPREQEGRPSRIPTVGLRGGRKVRYLSDAKGRSTSHAHSGCMLGKGACVEVRSWIWSGATLWAKLANAWESRGAGETRLGAHFALPAFLSRPYGSLCLYANRILERDRQVCRSPAIGGKNKSLKFF